MRNVYFIGLLIFIAVAAGGYGINWYAQANTTKSAIEGYIARLNEKQKYITYDSIETTGFPSKVNVSIIKPRFHGRMDQFLKDLRPVPQPVAGQPATPEPMADMEAWDEDLVLNGKITFGINAVSDYYSMIISGNWQEASTFGATTFKHTTQPTGDVSCSLRFQRSTGIFDTLWDFNQLNRDFKALTHDFRAVDCNTLGQTTTDDATKGVLSSAGLTRIYITNTPQMEDSTQVRVYMKVTDMEITALGDTAMTSYMRALAPSTAVPYSMSLYGKQNADIDFTYVGPRDFKDPKPRLTPSDRKDDKTNIPIDILLSKFDIHNNLYNYTMAFRFTNVPKNKDRVTTVYLKSEANFTEQYDNMLHTIARNMIQQITGSTDPKMREAQAMMSKYTPDQLYAIIYPAIPRLNPLGKMVIAFDGGFQGFENLGAGTFNLNAFEISMAPYSITGKGEIKTSPGEHPGGKVYLACSNCLNIIDDLNNYGTRLQQAVNYFDQQKAATLASGIAHADALKRFLSVLAVSGKDATGNPILAFNINSVNNNTTVNDKSMSQIMVLFNEYLGAGQPQPAENGSAARLRRGRTN